jgi:hypothetical protein
LLFAILIECDALAGGLVLKVEFTRFENGLDALNLEIEGTDTLGIVPICEALTAEHTGLRQLPQNMMEGVSLSSLPHVGIFFG